MKQLKRLVAASVGLSGLLVLLVGAASAPQDPQDDAPPKYIGVRSCKKCHNKSSTGKQFKVWSSKKHAKAYELLSSEHSLEVAKKAGVEGNPAEAAECLRCHTTAYGLPKKTHYGPKFSLEDGVSCEACHGAGEFFAKPVDGKIHTEAVGKGYVEATEELCRSCHNDTSPTWDPERDTLEDGTKTGFDYKKRLEMILHPISKKDKKDGK
jgi:hypothetical protein